VQVNLTTEDWLAVVDAALLATAGVGYLAIRRLKALTASDLPTAFQVLDQSIGRYASEMPPGHSWGEAFEWLKDGGVKADWTKMKERLGEYEAFRYGGRALASGGQEEIVALALELRRSIVGKRTKGKSHPRG
jgi:hypothetical protein